MQFGMPTLVEHQTLEESAQLCKELGLAFIELNMNLPAVCQAIVSGDPDKTQHLRRIADSFSLYFTIHLEENMNVCDFNPAVTDAYLHTVRKAIRTAIEIEAPLLNMHLHKGVYFTLPDGKAYLYERYPTHYRKSLEVFRQLCEQETAGTGIVIAIENTSGFAAFEKPAIEFLLESDTFGLTWDIGHSHSANEADEPFLLEHANKLRHFHIHDANGSKNHLPLSAGKVDIASRLAVAKKHGCRCVIETKTAAALKESVLWLKNS